MSIYYNSPLVEDDEDTLFNRMRMQEYYRPSPNNEDPSVWSQVKRAAPSWAPAGGFLLAGTGLGLGASLRQKRKKGRR
jgi:hypothetical protein